MNQSCKNEIKLSMEDKPKRSFSKTYHKGYEITDDALIFIKDALQMITIENKEGHREFKDKVRITIKLI